MLATKTIKKIANLKRNLFAAPLRSLFAKVQKGDAGTTPIAIPYRKGGEKVWFVPRADSVIVIYGVRFVDPDDIIFGQVFLRVHMGFHSFS